MMLDKIPAGKLSNGFASTLHTLTRGSERAIVQVADGLIVGRTPTLPVKIGQKWSEAKSATTGQGWSVGQ